jgi:hypothetical protein
MMLKLVYLKQLNRQAQQRVVFEGQVSDEISE